jgi:hypothetical protein
MAGLPRDALERKEASDEETEGQEEVLNALPLDTVKSSRWTKRTGP